MINNNIETVFQNVPLTNHFAEYVWLKTQYQLANIVENEEFKNRYANFWRMNQARLSAEYKTHYFTILQNIRNNNHQQIEEIVNELYLVPTHTNGVHQIQFSFATKLMHTFNSNLPIYDSLITDFFFLSHVRLNQDYNSKKNQYLNRYLFLIAEYQRIIDHNLLTISINSLREMYQLNELVTDYKIIDSIIWSFTKYLRQGGLENRNIFYT